MKKYIRILRFCKLVRLAAVIILLGSPFTVMAQQTCSGAYCSNEYHFGTGGEVDLNSSQYKARGSAGDLGVGSASSTNYRGEAGSTTIEEEYLEFIVNTTNVDLGVLSPSSASTATATFSVSNYLSSGYALLSYGTPLTMGSHTFTNLATPTASSPGTEQFGINLVDNSSPNVGTDPVQIPDSTFSFGVTASGYGTLNSFKFVSGDPVATSPKSSGKTNYTVSYLANISNLTPGGTYTMAHLLIAVPTY